MQRQVITLERFAGNWDREPDFCWFGRPEDPDEAQRWGLYVLEVASNDDPVEQTNCQAIQKDLAKFIKRGVARIEYHSHWAAGTITTLAIRAKTSQNKPTKVFLALQEIDRYLKEEYPVLDEDLLSDIEYERWTESFKSELRCYDFSEVQTILIDEIGLDALQDELYESVRDTSDIESVGEDDIRIALESCHLFCCLDEDKTLELGEPVFKASPCSPGQLRFIEPDTRKPDNCCQFCGEKLERH